MPRRRRRKAFRRTRRKRRTFRRRRRRRPRGMSSTFIRMPTVIPDRMFVRLKIQEDIRLLNSGIHFLKVTTNSPVQPLSTVTHQALGFQQWSAFYSFYKVHFANIRVQILNRTADQHIDVVFVWTPSTSAIELFTTTTNWSELPYATHFLIMSQNSGSSRVRTYKKGMAIKKVQGEKITHEEYDSDVFSSPAKKSFFYVMVNNSLNNSAVSTDVEINIQITFYTVFWQRVNLNTSLAP